jgi:hypothetical protein
MNKAVVVMGMIIVFIAVFSSLSIVNTIVSKFMECKVSMFSMTSVKCDMVDIGKTMMSGIWIVSLLSIVSTFAVFILAKVSSMGSGKKYYDNPYSY